MLNDNRPLVSIVIKALNEERHIASAIESALVAIDEVGGEVILADSASTDRTVEIARSYPIKIVQMSNVEDRSCGAGAQLGYQHSRGRYVCLIDGDMKLRPGFLPAAIRHLEAHGTLAGVGGMIIEAATGNREFEQRARRDEPDRRPGPVVRLDCGGLYRRSAIEAMGYFTDRNLHGGEEGELGARLRARGWTLERIDVPAIDHRGHSGNAYGLLIRRITSKIAYGSRRDRARRVRPRPPAAGVSRITARSSSACSCMRGGRACWHRCCWCGPGRWPCSRWRRCSRCRSPRWRCAGARSTPGSIR